MIHSWNFFRTCAINDIRQQQWTGAAPYNRTHEEAAKKCVNIHTKEETQNTNSFTSLQARI